MAAFVERRSSARIANMTFEPLCHKCHGSNGECLPLITPVLYLHIE